MHNIFSRGLVAVLSVSACSVVLAIDPVAIQSSSNIDNLSYTLQDLNAQDGMNPSFIPSTNPQKTTITLTAGAYFRPDYPPSVTLNALPFDSSGQIITGPDFTASSKSGNNLAAKTNLMLPMLANLVQTETTSQIPATASFSSSSLWTLGAHSQVTIQGSINSSIDFDTAQLLNSGASGKQTFVAETYYNGFFYTFDASGNQVYLGSSLRGSLFSQWNPLEGGLSIVREATSSQLSPASVNKSFTLTLSNDTAFAEDVYLVFSGGSQVNWRPVPDNPAIPEPSTYALMALGLGLMAWRVRTARRA